MVGACLGGATTEVVDRVAGFEQSTLGDSEPLVGLALFRFQARDRRARFLLALIERVPLIFGLAPLTAELFALLRQPRLLVDRMLQLRVVADDRLLLLVLLGVQRGDCIRRVRDG